MIIFPQLVFAHAVLELRMALDDYVNMDQTHLAMHKKGWCIEAGAWSYAILAVLQWQRPAIKVSTSRRWPWIRMVSDRIHEQKIQIALEDQRGGRSLVHPAFSASAMRPSQSQVGPASLEERTEQAAAIRGGSEQDAVDRSNAHEQGALYYRDSLLTKYWPDYYERVRAADHPGNCFEHKLPRWTLTHVYFENMGGIEVNQETLSADYLASTLLMPPSAPEYGQGTAGVMTAIGLGRLIRAQIDDKG